MNLHLRNVATLLSGFDEQWAFCGGWSIDLALNKVTRKHKDLDVAIFRVHQLIIQEFLSSRGWLLEYADKGKLHHWEKDEFLELPIHTIWCKHENHEPDFFEILLNEHDETHFIFRRDARIKRELAKAFVKSKSGYMILAPEIALLYKSNYITHAGNQHDFEVGIQLLDSEQCQWLKDALTIVYDEHKWIEAINSQLDRNAIQLLNHSRLLHTTEEILQFLSALEVLQVTRDVSLLPKLLRILDDNAQNTPPMQVLLNFIRGFDDKLLVETTVRMTPLLADSAKNWIELLYLGFLADSSRRYHLKTIYPTLSRTHQDIIRGIFDQLIMQLYDDEEVERSILDNVTFVLSE